MRAMRGQGVFERRMTLKPESPLDHRIVHIPSHCCISILGGRCVIWQYLEVVKATPLVEYLLFSDLR